MVIQWFMILGIQAKQIFGKQGVAFVSSQEVESHKTICFRIDEHVKFVFVVFRTDCDGRRTVALEVIGSLFAATSLVSVGKSFNLPNF